MCNGVFVENEFHVLFRCTKYKTNRDKFVPVSLRMNPTMDTLYTVLTTFDNVLLKTIVLFLDQILKERVNKPQE